MPLPRRKRIAPASELPPHDWHAPIIAAVVQAYERYRPSVYVEIGVDRGYTVRTVAPHVSRVMAVDVTFDNLDIKVPKNVIQMEMSSDRFFGTWRSSEHKRWPPDVIFIDGDHNAEQVWLDLVNALTIIARDGVIILHDTLPLHQRWQHWCGDAYQAMLRLEGIGYQYWTLPLFPGLSFVSHRYIPLLNSDDTPT